MNYSDFRKNRQTMIMGRTKERRPVLNSDAQRFLYSLRIKTMEYRTLMSVVKETLDRTQIDDILVEYSLRVRKAKNNFEKHNYDYEWDVN